MYDWSKVVASTLDQVEEYAGAFDRFEDCVAQAVYDHTPTPAEYIPIDRYTLAADVKGSVKLKDALYSAFVMVLYDFIEKSERYQFLKERYGG